jgi:hypothetical protein
MKGAHVQVTSVPEGPWRSGNRYPSSPAWVCIWHLTDNADWLNVQSARSGRSERARGESLNDQSGLGSFARYRAPFRAGLAEGLI